jgi:hypothetical protein
MLPDALAFISYKRVIDLSVCMSNNSFVPVLGRGTAVFSFNGKRALVQNVLHVPGLVVPLYSLRAHLKQRGCGFIGTFEDGFHVYFPTFILSVDMSSDCHLTYKSLSTLAPLLTFYYIQPRYATNLYPSETLATSSMSTPHPVVIEDEDAVLVAGISSGNDSAILPPAHLTVSPTPLPMASPTTPPPTVDLGRISVWLKSLTCLVQRLLPSTPVEELVAPATPVLQQVNDLIAPALPVSFEDLPSPKLLSTLSHVDVILLLHHKGTVLPSVCPYNTANSSNKKTHWSAKEL